MMGIVIPESIKDETLKYRHKVRLFLDGRTTATAFRAYRVPMGIYEHRTVGKFMVRIRIGAGLVSPAQLQRISVLSKAYGNGILHITTRQDIQIHDVDIENTPDILEGLLEVGLSSRGGGGNTVRNITACPQAGVCPQEEFDVAPYAIALAEYLLQDRSSFNLPRKYKIVFSGCAQDCAFASVADLGFFAHKKDCRKGFAVYAAGGLGSNPAVAIKMEDFVTADEIFEVAEAVKRLFDKHGDRTNKHKARLRYVLARLGAEEFRKLYRQEREILKTDSLPCEVPQIRDISSSFPVPENSVTCRLWLKNGDIPADDLDKVGQIAANYGQGLVRTTQLQDLLITGVAVDDVETVNAELQDLSIDCLDGGKCKIVACAGASTCKLGLCRSRSLAEAIYDSLSRIDTAGSYSGPVIRISGCPNSCGHNCIADIGLQGRAKRLNGRLLPCYDIMIGAKTTEGEARLARKIGTVPARRIPELMAQLISVDSDNPERRENIIREFCDDGNKALPEDYFYDFGSDTPFSLAGRGPGECGAGVMDVINLDIDEAKDLIRLRPSTSENIYKAILAAARALLVTFGLEPGKDREIFAAFSQYLVEPGWTTPQTQQIVDNALDWKMGDRQSLEDMTAQVEGLIHRIEELSRSLDANLQFKIPPVARTENDNPTCNANHVIDLRGITCPLNFVKAKLELEKLIPGDILEIMLDDGEPVRNVPASFSEQGKDVLDIKNMGTYYNVRVRR